MSLKQPIGVFDSGIGGLTALRKLVQLLPHEDFIYLGDTARVPYGNLSPTTIQQYAQECVQFLLSKSVKFILVACNTVSATALAEIEKISPVPVIGVVKPAAMVAMQQLKPHKRIGIIGTRATIASRAYELAIEECAANTGQQVSVYTTACPLFVPLVEEGWYEHPATYAIAQEYLGRLQERRLDSLILACTHYPFLKKVIGDIMPQVDIIDSGAEAAILTAELIDPVQQQSAHVVPGVAPSRSIQGYFTDLPQASLGVLLERLGLSQLTAQPINLSLSKKSSGSLTL